MREIELSYRSGAEVLEAVWGYVSSAGLRILATEPIEQGEQVRLRITVRSTGKAYCVIGRVVGERPGRDGLRHVLLDPPDAEQLLDAAWAETERVPQRRWRRVTTDLAVRYGDSDAAGGSQAGGRLVNLSPGGCCLVGPVFPVGTRVRVSGAGLGITGVVRWCARGDRGAMGVEFVAPVDADAVERLRVGGRTVAIERVS